MEAHRIRVGEHDGARPPGTRVSGLRVLVVEDDAALARTLRRALVLAGHDVTIAGTVAEGASLALVDAPAMVVLDRQLPDGDGLELCRRLRDAGDDVPVLVLTGLDAVSDRVSGLDAGADDYLAKPFSVEELMARTRALARRAVAREVGTGGGRHSTFADLVLDHHGRSASRGGRAIELTTIEYTLLDAFLRNPGRVLTRELLYESVWGHDFTGMSNTLDVHVSALRRKLEAGGEQRLLKTVRGTGYVLRERVGG